MFKRLMQSLMNKTSIETETRESAYVKGMFGFSSGGGQNPYTDPVLMKAWESGYHDAKLHDIRKGYRMQFDAESG